MSGRRGLLWIGLVVVVVAAVFVAGRGTTRSDRALDPAGTGPNGLKAMVLLAESFGADVQVIDGVPAGDRTVALLPNDRLGSADTDALREWVRRGNTLVVTDAQSTFAPAVGTSAIAAQTRAAGDCTIAALAKARAVEVAAASVFRTPADGSHCFTTASGSLIVASPEGRGVVVAIGTPSLFTNANLARSDNAYVAVALLAPQRGTKVAFVRGGTIGSGRETLWGLIRPGIRYGFLQLALAFVAYAAWRGRRLGRPLPETPPVEIEGSELVSAVGNLLSRSGSPTYAATVLRADTRAAIARRLGQGRRDGPGSLAAIVAARTGDDPAPLEALLADTPVRDDGELVALAQRLQQLREEVVGGQ